MKIRAIRLDGGSAGTIRIEPRERGATVIPLEAPLGAEALARAIRETLGAEKREALRTEAPLIEIHLLRGSERALVQDDAGSGQRVLVETPASGPERVLAADTGSLTDVLSIERLLRRVACTLELETSADVLPALAHGAASSPPPPSPKQLAYQRAFEEMRAITKNLESIDRTLSTSPQPNWVRVAWVVGGSGVCAALVSVLIPSWAATILGLTVLALLIYLIRLGQAALAEIKSRESLPEEATLLRPALEAARERVAELAETLRRRGEDPDEVLESLIATNRRGQTPSVLARGSVSWAELLALEEKDAQALVFVSGGNAGGDDFGGRVRRPQNAAPPSAELGALTGE